MLSTSMGRARLAIAAGLVLALTQESRAALPKVKEGFQIRLVASVPAVHYPCQIATAPDGSLFVAEDPMDQVGPYESDNGKILLIRPGKEPVVFAEGFRAIFGMAWRDGSLYVMHMPRLTVLKDKDGDGKADQATDLFRDLGPGPKALNDHIVSGLQFGIDGRLYIAVGDKGVPGATGPDGRKVQLKGGGTLRCNPDGTKLEVYSSGTRNHLEANLDDRDNLFTYDNTDDGDGWWTRVTHHVDGGYYGYPYDYHDRPDRFLNRMAEYGGGSPCGAVFYKDDAWPEQFRGRGLWAEWGKRAVRAIKFRPKGASFEVEDVMDLVEPGEVSDFRPIDLALSHDGKTLYIADWSMGGWGSKTEKVGRVYAVTWAGPKVETQPRGIDADPIPAQIKQLAHPAFQERMRAQKALIARGELALPSIVGALNDERMSPVARRHLLWTLDAIAGGSPKATLPIVAMLKSPVPDLRAQAARALGIREIPLGLEDVIELVKDPEPTVRLQAVIALGRIGSPDAIASLTSALADTDPYISFSARVALRRIADWKAIKGGLASKDAKVREGLIASADLVYDVDAVAMLKGYLDDTKADPKERALAVRNLAEVHRKAAPWDGSWWGTRPSRGKAPEKVIAWEATPTIDATVKAALADKAAPIRKAGILAAQSMNVPAMTAALRERFAAEPSEELKKEIALALGKLGDKDSIAALVAAIRSTETTAPVRDASLASVEKIGGPAANKALVEIVAASSVPADRIPSVIEALGRSKSKDAVPTLLKALGHASDKVRAAAATAVGNLKPDTKLGAASKLRPLLKDSSIDVRKAAIGALGSLEDRESIPSLITAANEEPTRFEATLALGQMPDIRALYPYLTALSDRSPELRKSANLALVKLRDQAAPALQRLADRKELPPSALPELRRVFSAFEPIRKWQVIGPFDLKGRPPFQAGKPIDVKATVPDKDGKFLSWKPVEAKDEHGVVELNPLYGDGDKVSVFGYAEFTSPDKRLGVLSLGSDDTLTVWLNGQQVYKYEDSRSYSAEAGRVDVTFAKGVNRVLVRCGNNGGDWKFSLAYSKGGDYAFLKGPAPGAFNPDAFRTFAIKNAGDPKRGLALFSDTKGVACIKCHKVAGNGGAVGPDLAGIASRYTKDELIASVLYPSAKIFSGYEPVILATSDGKTLTGILKADTPEAVEIEDAEAKRIKVPKSEIEERKVSDVSLMPNGLAEGLSTKDFADLIAYLETLKDAPAARPGSGAKAP